jgi:hypothetical protein
MKYLIIFFFSIWSLFAKLNEPIITFKGKIIDQTSKKPLMDCRIKVRYSNGSTMEATTNNKGTYELQLKPGNFTIDYNCNSYQFVRETHMYNPSNDTTIIHNIVLIKYRRIMKDSSYMMKDGMKEEKLILKETRHRGITKDSYSPVATGGTSTESFTLSKSMGAMSSDDISMESVSGRRVTYASGGINKDIKAGMLTAGEINDFSKWHLWEDLNKSDLGAYVSHWQISPKHRFNVQITNSQKSPLADLLVYLKDPSGKTIWKSHTDNTGKAELWANLYDSTLLLKGKYTIGTSLNGINYSIKDAALFSNGLNKIVIPTACAQPLNMDIVFAVDATGSMGDEIRYLQAELYDVIEKVKQGNKDLNLQMGSVFYRDKGDAYLTVQQDLTPDINQVMDFIKNQSAEGGGDEPEAVDAAMEIAIGQFKWRSEARARVMFLVLDASPHHDKETMDKLEMYTKLAAEKGIRIVPIVCSGIDKPGEYLMRSLALATNGNYIFLTDHSGIGDGHITPTTDKFEVETLNILLIRLLQQYIFMPNCNQTVNTAQIDSLQHNNPDSTFNDSSFVQNPNINSSNDSGNVSNKSDLWFLKYYPNPCKGLLKVEINAAISDLYIADINGKLLMKISVANDEHYKEIDMSAYPSGVYFLRYCVEGKCKSGKFILIH